MFKYIKEKEINTKKEVIILTIILLILFLMLLMIEKTESTNKEDTISNLQKSIIYILV